MQIPIAVAVAATLILAGCSGTVDDVVGPEAAGLTVTAGLSVEVVVDGLVGPTQFAVSDDELVVAVINGGENDGTGQVLRLDLAGDAAGQAGEILRDGLDKPTGMVVVDDELWIMERDRLTRSRPGQEPVVVADDLPNNGRSQGSLTVTPEGHILFDTSGSKRGAEVTAGSGRLFTVDPAEVPGRPVELASGFKHAYAHVFDADGTLWSTEMSDGRFDGSRAADEVVAVSAGADHGWPRCVGDNRPVVEFGGSAEFCAAAPPSLALFAPGATPTSVVVSPFDPGQLLVALWVEGRIVAVDIDGDDPGAFSEVVSGLSGPQHLVAVDGAVLVSEFGPGRILRITAAP